MSLTHQRPLPFILASSRYRADRSHVSPLVHGRGLAITAGVLTGLVTVATKARGLRGIVSAAMVPLTALLTYQAHQATVSKSNEHEHLDEQVSRLQQWALSRYDIVLLTPEATTLLDGLNKRRRPTVRTYGKKPHSALQLLPTHASSTFEYLLAEEDTFLPQLQREAAHA